MKASKPQPQFSYKYLGIFKVDGIKYNDMKEKTKREYLRRVRKILTSKLNVRNINSAINSRVVAVVWYGSGILT